MTVVVTCDVCKEKPAVGKVQVGVTGDNVVEKGTSTGVSLEMDACETCRPIALKQLAEQAIAQLESHIPLHRTMYAARDREAAALAEFQALDKAIAAQIAKDGTPTPEQKKRQIELQIVIDEARAAFDKAFKEGEKPQ